MKTSETNYKMNLLLIHFILLTLCFTLVSSCNTTDPPPPPPPEKVVSLSVSDFSLNEIWITISTENFTGLKNIKISRDGSKLFSFTLLNADTVIYNDSLLPAKTYSYDALGYDVEDDTIRSETLIASTMDTTSHNFTYEMFTFGDYNNSKFRDLAIISENDIWAVGEIYEDDEKYNAAHWDGIDWELKQIYYSGDCSAVDIPLLSAVYYISNQIYITNGGSIGKFDGENVVLDCSVNLLLDGAINAIWGDNIDNFYVVGGLGSIVHYSGNIWTKIETVTDLTLVDVYGTPNGDVYAAGSYSPTTRGVVLRGNSTDNWQIVIEGEHIDESQLFEKLYGSCAAIWIDERNTVYTGGHILYEYKNNAWNYINSLPENYIGGNTTAQYRGFISGIRGNASNDWVICGDRNTLKHFNGSTWKQLGLPYDPSSDIRWLAVAQKENLIVTVGDEGNKAAIILLKR